MRISFDLTDREVESVKTFLPMLERFKHVIPISLLSVLEKY